MTPLRANALLVLAALFWGCGNVAQKTVLDHIGPFMTTGLTALLGALILLPLVHRESKRCKPGKRPEPRDLVIAGLVFTAAVSTLQIAYGGTSVTNAGFLVNTCAAMTPLAAWLILRETPAIMLGPAIALVAAGAWFMGGYAMTAFAWGDAVCILSAALFAVSVPLVGRFVLLYGRPTYLTCVQFAICGVVCTCIGLAIETTSLGALRAALPEIILIGVVAKGLAYLSMAVAQQSTRASTAAIIVSAEAVFGAIAANLVLGEVMTGPTILGGGLILSSIVVVHFADPAAAFRRLRGMAFAMLHAERRDRSHARRRAPARRSAFDARI
jgi:drug/metabolite transporter (DMT)-like permease